ncbi:MAG: GMC oxidoreductase, partial [Pseudonocardiaceae bacterium]
MRKRYDAIVVGSGFGGAVAACRLAQAGLRVAVLERGRQYPLGGFPRNWTDVSDGWLWQHEQGLFDVRPINEVSVVQSAAYGGGSHIYANIHIRVPPDLFDSGWPDGYSRTTLDPYYDLVAYMLDVRPIGPDQPLGLPPKTRQMLGVAQRLRRTDQLFLPNLAINFGDPETSVANKFGVKQYGCRHCGECDIGCNFQAKNTLDLNYLAVAEQRGADIGTRCEVTRIATRDGGYEVSYVDRNAEPAPGDPADAVEVIQAPTVVLGAGAVNTTELLLRCRDQYATLPALPAHLGTGYSANGDFLAFAFDTARAFEPAVGPTITTSMVYDRGAGSGRHWFLFQEGGVPRQVVSLLQVLDDQRLGGLLRVPHDLTTYLTQRAGERIGKPSGETDDLAIFLAMGRDTADGTIGLRPAGHELRIVWHTTPNLPLYETQERFCADVARALGGHAAYNPLWQRFRIPVAVHNLGGCPMSDDPEQGVTDGNGQVHGHPGLYVLDGGCLPSATGVNPSHTIAAVAERNIETAIRKITGNRTWVAPERALAAPVHDPLGAVTIPVGGTRAVSTPGVGLTFTQTMRGYLRRDHRPAADFRGAVKAARRAGARASFTLDVMSPFLSEFIADEAHRMTAEGVVHVHGVTGRDGARVGNGVINLLVAGDSPTSRRMLYTLPFFGADGRPYLLDGHKDVRDHGSFDIWGSTTTLYTYLRRGHTPRGEVLSTGILQLPLLTFVRQVATAKVTGTSNPLRQAEALARFGQFFLGSLWSVYLAPRLPNPVPVRSLAAFGGSDDQRLSPRPEAVTDPRR